MADGAKKVTIGGEEPSSSSSASAATEKSKKYTNLWKKSTNAVLQPLLPIKKKPARVVNYNLVGWRVADAERGVLVNNYPRDPRAFDTYMKWLAWRRAGFASIFVLMVGTFFEVPYWCVREMERRSPDMAWAEVEDMMYYRA